MSFSLRSRADLHLLDCRDRKEIALAAFVKVDDDKTGFASFVNYGKRSVNAVFFQFAEKEFSEIIVCEFPEIASVRTEFCNGGTNVGGSAAHFAV